MQKKLIINTYTVIELLFLLGVYMKQFYLRASGSAQIGDLLMMAAFGLWVLHRRGRIAVKRDDVPLLWFIGCVVVINGVYYTIIGSSNYAIVSFYYIFNMFVVLLFSDLIRQPVFTIWLCKVMKLCILTQVVIYLIGKGRWFGTVRYEGTFNDPNQFGFYLIAAFLIIFVVSKNLERKNWGIWYILVFLLVTLSASTGMLLGMSFFLLAVFLMQKNKLGIFFAILLMLILALMEFSFVLPESIQSSFLYRRVIEKLDKFGMGESTIWQSLEAFLAERGLMKIVYYPENMLYGAGEGDMSRFVLAGDNELHSTFISILFYYGVIPFVIFLTWCVNKLKNIRTEIAPAYIALIIESFTLLNQRQPFFWMLFVLAGWSLSQREKEKKIRKTGRITNEALVNHSSI